MASGSMQFRSRCFLMLAACIWLVSCCKSDQAALHNQRKDTADIVGRAVICLNDRYIYSGCQASLRLGAQGTMNVPPQSTDAFCGGPCLEETSLVLKCIDDIMNNFRFYNGASVGDVRFALDRGCGHTGLRGDFDVLQRLGADGYYGDSYFYNHGNKPDISLKLQLLWSIIAILFVW